MLAIIPALIFAHITLDLPLPRYADQKYGPCGSTSDARTTNVTTIEPGATIVVRWAESINHPAHYRISFDSDGVDDFADPATMQEFNTNATVLLDGIEDFDGGAYSAEVTLPDLECDTCTLQLIQVMYDKPPYETGSNDIYYQCADIVLAVGAGVPPELTMSTVPGDTGPGLQLDDDPSPGESDGGCGCASGSGPAMAWVILPLFLAVRARPRR